MLVGGKAIASGSQGCIFRPKLNVVEVGRRGIARNSTEPNTNGHIRISKVFANEDVFNMERILLTKVNNITAGVGTIDIQEFAAINTIHELHSEVPDILKTISGCAHILKTLREGNPVYVFHQRMISGDLYRNPVPRPLRFYKNAFDAITKLLINNIVHLDLAKRNVFFDDAGALLGDFGFGIDMNMPDVDFDASLQEYYKTHCYHESNFNTYDRLGDTLKKQNTITAEATLALYIYKCFDERDEYFDLYDTDRDFKADLRSKTAYAADPANSEYFNKDRYNAVAEQMRRADKDTIREILKRELRQADFRIFLMTIFSVIQFADEAQKTSYFEAIGQGDYDIFYRLLGEEPAADIRANITALKTEGLSLPIGVVSAAARAVLPAGARAGAGAASLVNSVNRSAAPPAVASSLVNSVSRSAAPRAVASSLVNSVSRSAAPSAAASSLVNLVNRSAAPPKLTLQERLAALRAPQPASQAPSEAPSVASQPMKPLSYSHLTAMLKDPTLNARAVKERLAEYRNGGSRKKLRKNRRSNKTRRYKL